MRKTILFSVLIFTLFISSNILYSQEIGDSSLTIDVDEIVVSATRSQTKVQNLPINIDVVNKRQIEESQPLSPVEALQYIPGITRQSDGGLASTPIIRGLSRERAPVLIDGKEMKIGGSIYGGYASVSEFYRGRIEIEGRGNGLDFLIGGGLRNAGNTMTPEGEIQNSQFESTNIDFNIGYSWAENHRVEISGKTFQNENVGFPGGLGAPGPPRVNRRFDPDKQTGINLAYDGTNISDKIESIGARVFFKKQTLHIDQITQIPFPMTMNINRRIHAMLDVDVPFMGGKFFATLRQNDNAKLTLGVDYLSEHRIGTHRDLNIQIMNPAGVMVNEINRPFTQIQPDSYSKSFGIFAIEEMHLGDKIDLLIAARLDNVSTSIDDGPFDIPAIAEIYNSDNTSDSDMAISGNIGLKYHATDALSFTANVANSFRGTDLFSKYHFTTVGQGFLVPNPDLDPERGVFFELGAKYKQNGFSVEANYFQNNLSNLFTSTDLVFDGSPSVQFQNIGEATLTGFEWDARAKIGTLSHVFLNGAMINGTNDITGNPLQEIPATQIWAGVHYRDSNNKFFIQPEFQLVSEQNDNAPNEITTPGYAIINLRTGVNLHRFSDSMPHSKLMFSITNIGDKAYRSHVSRGAPGNQNTFLEAGRSFNIGFVMRIGEHLQ